MIKSALAAEEEEYQREEEEEAKGNFSSVLSCPIRCPRLPHLN